MNDLNGGSGDAALWGMIVFLFLGILFLLFFSGRRIRQSKRLAQFDPITGGLNSIGFEERAKKYLSGKTQQHAIVTMEVCNYRQMLQTFGRDKTNEAMKFLHRVLETSLGSTEPSGRIQGGTFCFFLKNRQESAIRARLGRILETVNQYLLNESIPYGIELRFGIYIPERTGESLTEIQEKIASLLEKNDEQLCFYRWEKRESAAKKWELIQQMDRSLINGDFVVYMNPKVRLSDSRIVGAEAVIRWRHPQRGMLTPEMFIPLLEEYHLVPRFDLYLFEQICKHMAQWKKVGICLCPVSMNLSHETVKQKNFLEPYVRLAKEYGISPELIEFELNKTLQHHDVNEVRRIVNEIHAHDFRCALDNYGDSTVPLHLLRELDVNTIKLDRSFFSSENNNRRNRFVIEAIIKIASQMQIHTVAEGIDNASQVQYLKQSGCDMVQGYHYFQPLPIDEFCNTVYQKGELRYIEEDGSRSVQAMLPADQNTSRSIVMFSVLLESDRAIFSHLFSPVLEGRLEVSNVMSLLRYSDLIHENDRKDFFHLLERCQKENGWVENAIRFYTATGRYEWIEVYLHKEYIPSVGETVIAGTLVNMTEWKNEINLWKEKANRDVLTGLYNREYFEQYVSKAMENKLLISAAIIFLDIDDFKHVNDTLGHMVGDDVICWFAKRVLGTFRHTDVVARYGGDEFVVFVNGIGRQELIHRLQQLCDDFRYPYRNGEVEYSVSASIGAAMFPGDGGTYLELLDRADSALYEAKHLGKNRFVIYHPELDSAAR